MLIEILIVILTILAISKHEEYRIKDDRTSNEDQSDRYLKRKWHFYKGVYQALIATLIGIAFGIDISLFFCVAFTIYHDAHINITALNKPIDYVGETAWLDKTLKKIFRKDRHVLIFKLFLLVGVIAFSIYSRM